MPIKMKYRSTPHGPWAEVLVYNFTYTEELECFALAWLPDSKIWLTVPVFMLEPIHGKKVLNEEQTKTDEKI